MSISPHLAPNDPRPSYDEETIPLVEGEELGHGSQFDRVSWAESRQEHEVATAGGRMVLGWALSLLALLLPVLALLLVVLLVWGLIAMRRRMRRQEAG
jgi:hypothetical protein